MTQASNEQEKIEKKLIDEFNRHFTRKVLEHNPYYVYKLTQNLQLRLEDILNERSIKMITSNKQVVLSALKKCDKVTVLDDNTSIKINLTSKKDVLTVKNPKESGEKEEFINFIKEQLKEKQQVELLNTENVNAVQLKFIEEKDALLFSQDLLKQTFKDGKIEVYFENENILQSLLKAVHENKKKTYPQQNGDSNQQESENPNSLNQQQLLMLQQKFFMQQQQLLDSSNFTRLCSTQDYSELYVRRPKDDAKKGKKGQGQNGMNMTDMNAYYQQYYAMQCMMPVYPMNMNMDQNQMQQQNKQGGRQNHRKQQPNRQNRNDKSRDRAPKQPAKQEVQPQQQQNKRVEEKVKTDRKDKSVKKENNNNKKNVSPKKPTTTDKKKEEVPAPKKEIYRPKEEEKQQQQQQQNRSISQQVVKTPKIEGVPRGTSQSKDKSAVTQLQTKLNRPRIDSESFTVLQDTNQKGEKESFIYVVRSRNPSVAPADVPYVENRTRIERCFNHFEIQTSFERWKVDKEMNTQLKKFMVDLTIPVINKSAITKLEIEQPYRKNSTAVTPLLSTNPQTQFRKRSFNISHTPNKGMRKFSSQK